MIDLADLPPFDSSSILKKTAINMLREEISDSLIREVTGLSQDEIDRLKNKL